MLRRSWAERKRPLRDQDQKREADPGWYRRRDLLGMMFYVNAFAGDLKGVKAKLGYIQECGANYLHLMPLLESPRGRSDGGYAVSDFRRVQPSLGTMEDLESLADACRRRGISLCLDFVMNHTSEDHAWAKRARTGSAISSTAPGIFPGSLKRPSPRCSPPPPRGASRSFRTAPWS